MNILTSYMASQKKNNRKNNKENKAEKKPEPVDYTSPNATPSSMKKAEKEKKVFTLETPPLTTSVEKKKEERQQKNADALEERKQEQQQQVTLRGTTPLSRRTDCTPNVFELLLALQMLIFTVDDTQVLPVLQFWAHFDDLWSWADKNVLKHV